MMRLRVITAACCSALATSVGVAAEAAGSSAEKLRGLGLAESGAGSLPLGRILWVFLLVVALAFCATWLLRRYGFRMRSAAGAGAAIRVLSRSALPGGTTCHVVEAQGKHVLITATRNGVSSVVLGDAPLATPVPPAVNQSASSDT